jgi:hypothetical protein
MIWKLLVSTVELKENQLVKDSKIYTLEKVKAAFQHEKCDLVEIL